MNPFMKTLKKIAAAYNGVSLILRIAIGLVVGVILALVCPGATWLKELGNLFVGALKGIAPVLVFVIVASALAQGSSKLDRRFGTVMWLYMLTTFVAAALSVVTSMLFPQMLLLPEAAEAEVIPQGLGEVMHTLLSNIVSNPISAIMNGNYIGILMWGLSLRRGDEEARCGLDEGLPQQHGGRGVHHRALDHQFGTVRHHGPCVHERCEQRPCDLHPVRQAPAAFGRHDALHGACHQPHHHLHLSALQSLSAGVPLPA